jgi:hypothetical protein
MEHNHDYKKNSCYDLHMHSALLLVFCTAVRGVERDTECKNTNVSSEKTDQKGARLAQERLNPQQPGSPFVVRNGTTFRIADKVNVNI